MRRGNCSGGMAGRANGLLLAFGPFSSASPSLLSQPWCPLRFAGASVLAGPDAPHTVLGSPDSAWLVCKRADVSCWQRFDKATDQRLWVKIRLGGSVGPLPLLPQEQHPVEGAARPFSARKRNQGHSNGRRPRIRLPGHVDCRYVVQITPLKCNLFVAIAGHCLSRARSWKSARHPLAWLRLPARLSSAT